MSNGYTSFDAMNDDKKTNSTAEPLLESKPAAEPATPGTMRAIVFTKFGDAKDVAKETQMPIPKISKDDEVLVKVQYAGMNPVDIMVMKGNFGSLSPRKPLIHASGCDFVGTVVAKGKGDSVRFLEVGEEVFGQVFMGSGTFAEYVICPSSNLTKKPSNISSVEAAAMPLVSQTAFQALQTMNLNEQSKLLILGGSSAVGCAAIQIAKNHFECDEVIVTSSKPELCMELGATSVVNYRDEKWHEVLKDYGADAIFDCVGGGIESWDLCRSQKVLKKDGDFVTICLEFEKMDAGNIMSMVGSTINRKFWNAMGQQNWSFLPEDASKNIDDIAALIESGKLKPVLADESPFAFADWNKMFDKMQSGKAGGKLVIAVDSKDEPTADDMDTAVVDKVVELAPVIEDGDGKEEEEPAVADAMSPEDGAKAEEEVKEDDVDTADNVDSANGTEQAGTDDVKVDEEPVGSDDVKVDEQDTVTEDVDTETAAVVVDEKEEDKETVTAEDNAPDQGVDTDADVVKNE